MDIRNAGNRIMNTWLYPIEGGWVMIDTGYENSYASVPKKLRKLLIRPEEVRYIFLTHAHDDHAGFLEEWMTKHPQTQIIAHEKAIDGLRKGQNGFDGGCSTLGAFLFCQLMAVLGNGEHRYPRLSEEHLAQIIKLNEDNLPPYGKCPAWEDPFYSWTYGRFHFSSGEWEPVLRRCGYEWYSQFP